MEKRPERRWHHAATWLDDADLGLMADARFHSAGVQRSVFFDVHTPPKRVRGAGVGSEAAA